MAEGLGGGEAVRDAERRSAAEILRARDVPVSVGPHPYGPCAQLHDGRRRCPLAPRHGPQRAAPDGLGCLRPAGRERRARQQGQPARLDLPEHRDDEGPIEDHGPVAGLGARDRDLRPVLLQAPAEDVPGFLARRPGRAQVGQGQLGSGGHDRARQRAGHRRARLALRRAGRAARPDAVVLQDHLHVAGSAGQPGDAGQVAGKGPADAGELDRPLRGPAAALEAGQPAGRRERAGSLHDPSGHHLRRVLHGHRRRSSAGQEGRRGQSEAGRLHRGGAASRHLRRRAGDRREEGSTLACASCIRSTRTGRCRSTSRILC